MSDEGSTPDVEPIRIIRGELLELGALDEVNEVRDLHLASPVMKNN